MIKLTKKIAIFSLLCCITAQSSFAMLSSEIRSGNADPFLVAALSTFSPFMIPILTSSTVDVNSLEGRAQLEVQIEAYRNGETLSPKVDLVASMAKQYATTPSRILEVVDPLVQNGSEITVDCILRALGKK